MGQSDELVEYNPSADAKTYFEQKEDGLHVSCVRAQRIYNNHQWSNPLVLKITNARPALEPPVVSTNSSEIAGIGNSARLILKGEIVKTGDADELKAGFEYREYAGFVEELFSDEWHETETTIVITDESFEIRPEIQKEGKTYQYRAFVDHPKLRIYGDIKRVNF